MTDQQTPFPSRTSGAPQETHGYLGLRTGVPNQGVPTMSSVSQGGQLKGATPGQAPMFPPGPVGNRNPPGVNGFSSSSVPPGPPASVNVRPPVRPSFPGQSFMNGPSGPLTSNQGPYRHPQPPTFGPPHRPPGFGPQGNLNMHSPGQQRLGGGPVSGETSSTSTSEGPPSQRSSNTNSPATVNTNLDALEGQFRNTPDQDTESSASGEGSDKQPMTDGGHMIQQATDTPNPFLGTVNAQASKNPVQQPHFPMPDTSSGPTSQPSSGFSTTNQRPGFPPTTVSTNQQPFFQPVSSASEKPRFPYPAVSANQQPGFPSVTSGVQRPSFPPSVSQTGPNTGVQQFQPSSQQSRFPTPMTTSQPAFGPPSTVSQRPGFAPPPASQPQGFAPLSAASQRPNFPSPTLAGQQPGIPPFSSSAMTQPSFAPGSQQPGITLISSASQRPGFPPASSTNQMPGFPPMSGVSQRPGFPLPQSSTIQQPRYQPVSQAGQKPGFPPPPTSANQQPGFPPMPTPTQRPGFPSPPVSANQMPGFPPPPVSANQQPGFPPPPVSTSQVPGFPPPPVSANQQQGFPPMSTPAQRPSFPPPPTSFAPGAGQQMNFNASQNQYNQVSGPGQMQPGQRPGKTIHEFVNSYPETNSLNASMGSMSIQPGMQTINLLQVKNLIPRDGVETPKPNIPNDTRKVNCSPEVFRCTLNAIPQTSALLNKARLPLGILIHPFKDLSSLPVIQSSVIVRCRSCRTYINPFVYFVDSRRWKCNLCYRVNELPDEFSFDPVSKTYGDPQRRPEIRSATIEFIAPSEYMLRPPQPAVYLYLLDVSFNAVETGYLNVFCETLLDVLDKIPGDSRTQIGFIAYDSAVHFFNLDEGLSQPQMLTVSDVDDIFLPCPDTLLVNLNESKERVIDLLNLLPSLFEGNMETATALGAALQAGFKMTSAVGGRITVMQTNLPTVGPGALHNREEASQQNAKDVPNLGPAIDFYKKLALDCSAQQIAVDLFMLNGQFADLASIECISKFSGGCVYYYPMFHNVSTPHLAEKFEVDLRRYFTRKIGFESVMRIRCSKGLSIHTFHGNFFVRSTDLLSLPNINPDAGYGMQMSIEESLTDMSTMCFQAALLYTSSKGERRIRVHTMCLPVTNQLSEIFAAADQQAIVALLAKMAVDRCITSSMSDAREAIVNAVIDVLNAYGSTLTSTQRVGSLCINDSLRLMPLYCLGLLKSKAFRINILTRLDDRVYALEQCKTLPVTYLIQMLHPDLYPVHTILEVDMVKKGSQEVPDLPLLQLSSANIDRFGAYLLDTGETVYLYIGSAINQQFCQDILDKPNFAAVKEGGMAELPELENQGSERLRSFLTYILDNRPNGTAFIIVREDGKYRMEFFQHFVEDRTESTMSYYEFLQHIQKQVKS